MFQVGKMGWAPRGTEFCKGVRTHHQATFTCVCHTTVCLVGSLRAWTWIMGLDHLFFETRVGGKLINTNLINLVEINYYYYYYLIKNGGN